MLGSLGMSFFFKISIEYVIYQNIHFHALFVFEHNLI